jgi:predicted ABC-type sugar transport system permease subunit
MTPATIVILALLVVAVGLIIYYFIRKKKRGEHICSCGGNCAACGLCSQKESQEN